MEYRDLYDSNRMLTNEKIKKTDKVPKGKYYITVVVFIQNDKNEFLLQINKKYNMWSTTGGHPKSGESSLDGIITEIKECIFSFMYCLTYFSSNRIVCLQFYFIF